MKKITPYLCTLIFLLLIVISCKTTKQEKQIYQENNRFDPVCGDSIVWHIHLQEGFINDTVEFVIGKDTFPNRALPNSMLLATSGNNGCTGIYLTCYKEEGKRIIFLDNMPQYTLLKEFEDKEVENLNINILINDMPIHFHSPLIYHHFFGLNYNSKEHGIAVLKGNSCFQCM